MLQDCLVCTLKDTCCLWFSTNNNVYVISGQIKTQRKFFCY